MAYVRPVPTILGIQSLLRTQTTEALQSVLILLQGLTLLSLLGTHSKVVIRSLYSHLATTSGDSLRYRRGPSFFLYPSSMHGAPCHRSTAHHAVRRLFDSHPSTRNLIMTVYSDDVERPPGGDERSLTADIETQLLYPKVQAPSAAIG